MKDPKIFFKTKINIGSYSISQTSKPMVIAEISANHNGSIELAKKIISRVFDLGFEPALENYSPKHDADWHSEAHFRHGHFGSLLKILHHPIHPMM